MDINKICLNQTNNFYPCRLQKAKQLNDALYEKFQVVRESELSAEERAARMDELLAEEENLQREVDLELKRLRELQFKKTEELHVARVNEKDTDAAIQGGRAATRNLNSKIYKLDHDSLKQQEIVYNQVDEEQFLSLPELECGPGTCSSGKLLVRKESGWLVLYKLNL